MRGDSNVVPLKIEGLRGIDSAIRAEAHVFIDSMPAHIVLGMLPVLRKYAARHAPPTERSGPDVNRITIHHRA